MPDENQYGSGATIHPAIQAEFHRLAQEIRDVEKKCDRRHTDYNRVFNTTRDRCEEHGRRLVTIAGEDGTDGKLAAQGKEIADMKDEVSDNRKLLIRVILAAIGTNAIATAITLTILHLAK